MITVRVLDEVTQGGVLAKYRLREVEINADNIMEMEDYDVVQHIKESNLPAGLNFKLLALCKVTTRSGKSYIVVGDRRELREMWFSSKERTASRQILHG